MSSLRKGLAFIFDLDGVLVHSMPLHTEAWRQYLTNLGSCPSDLEERMHGKRNAELVADLIASDLPDDVIFEHGAAKERLWRELMVSTGLDQYRIPGLEDFLARYRDVPKAIGSNAEPENIDFVLDAFHLRSHFSTIVDGMQVTHPKPFPDIYLKCAELLGIPPQNCIVFEDSPTGLKAGKAAGMRLVGVETTASNLPGVDFTIRDFANPELDRWLHQQQPV